MAEFPAPLWLRQCTGTLLSRARQAGQCRGGPPRGAAPVHAAEVALGRGADPAAKVAQAVSLNKTRDCRHPGPHHTGTEPTSWAQAANRHTSPFVIIDS